MNNLVHMEDTIKASEEKLTPLPPSLIVPGGVCLAPFKDNQGMQAYYRARIEDVFSQDGKQIALVMLKELVLNIKTG